MDLNPNLDVCGENVPLWERYQQGGRKRPLNNELMYLSLVQVSKVLNNHGVRWFASHGSCLGLIRGDGAPSLPWDDDFDISMYFEQRPMLEAVYNDLRSLGFYCPPSDPTKPMDPKSNSPYYDMVAIHQSWGEKIEGWFFEKIGNERIYDYPRCKRLLAFPESFFENLGSVKFRDLVIPIPSNVEDYLVRMYGLTWNKVDKNKKYQRQD